MRASDNIRIQNQTAISARTRFDASGGTLRALRRQSNSALIGAAQDLSRQGRTFLVRLRPYVLELSRRVKLHKVPGVRTQADLCARIQCSRRWLELIVSGKWRHSNDRKKMKGLLAHPRGAIRAKLLTDHDYANTIVRFAFRKLEPIVVQDNPRFRAICKLLEEHFTEASQRRSHEEQAA